MAKQPKEKINAKKPSSKAGDLAHGRKTKPHPPDDEGYTTTVGTSLEEETAGDTFIEELAESLVEEEAKVRELGDLEFTIRRRELEMRLEQLELSHKIQMAKLNLELSLIEQQKEEMKHVVAESIT